MTLSQSLAQSLSSLCKEAESGIKRIVVHRELCPGVDPSRSEPEAELLLLQRKFQLQEYSFLTTALLLGCVFRKLAG
jgi:hypothetical protein